ncbi:MAG: kinase [Candidatus Cloacimonadota bacterium]|nr:MAG: kinase [Candidatus Cloacimonadota bacterium]
MNEKVITFLKSKDYIFKAELGRGSCGRTVLLYDPEIDQNFVCKKYDPQFEELKITLFENFKREIKSLYNLNHVNIVRIFNYHMYNEELTGYILMEYIEGTDIEGHLQMYPEQINSIFEQSVGGFLHLEDKNILHRDIRPLNILVTSDGTVKIIDFGFTKKIRSTDDFQKSISLNWWCEIPQDFNSDQYDFTTEVYFLGKLFEKIINDLEIDNFKYKNILRNMCLYKPSERTCSFSKVQSLLYTKKFEHDDFTRNQTSIYRDFSDNIFKSITRVGISAKYYQDGESIEKKLSKLYGEIQLEEYIPSINKIIRCFVNGDFFYSSNTEIHIKVFKNFLELLHECSVDRKNLIFRNLSSKIDSLPKYDDEEVPF